MPHTNSADGTKLVYDRVGDGPAVVIIGGGPTTRVVNAELAALLGAECTVYNYDRRGHGDSGDTPPFHPDREYEDVAAMLAAAGGEAAFFGSSGGAVIALEAAARGLPITRLALWEPSYIVPGTRPAVPADYADRLAALIAEGRRGEAGELFFAEAVGLPREFIDGMTRSPFWPAVEAVAHTLVYDAALVGDFSIPVERLARVKAPTLIIDGGTTPWLSTSADTAAGALPDAERHTIAGQPHNFEAAALAPVVARFVAGDGV